MNKQNEFDEHMKDFTPNVKAKESIPKTESDWPKRIIIIFTVFFLIAFALFIALYVSIGDSEPVEPTVSNGSTVSIENDEIFGANTGRQVNSSQNTEESILVPVEGIPEGFGLENQVHYDNETAGKISKDSKETLNIKSVPIIDDGIEETLYPKISSSNEIQSLSQSHNEFRNFEKLVTESLNSVFIDMRSLSEDVKSGKVSYVQLANKMQLLTKKTSKIESDFVALKEQINYQLKSYDLRLKSLEDKASNGNIEIVPVITDREQVKPNTTTSASAQTAQDYPYPFVEGFNVLFVTKDKALITDGKQSFVIHAGVTYEQIGHIDIVDTVKNKVIVRKADGKLYEINAKAGDQ